MTRRNLDILHLPDVASLARHLPFARVGVIEAGQMDYVRKLPREDIKVLQVDALIVGNGCAPDGVTQGFLTAVAEVFPTFVSHNKGQANLTGLPLATVATNFYNADGHDLLGKYAPWAVDIMPLPTWIQLGVAFSVLFSGMALWHRFRLWRVDANRVKIEREIAALFAPGATIDTIAEMPLDARHRLPDAHAQIDHLVLRLSALSERCRKQSLSVLVPMGEEMSYRYQETQRVARYVRYGFARKGLPPLSVRCCLEQDDPEKADWRHRCGMCSAPVNQSADLVGGAFSCFSIRDHRFEPLTYPAVVVRVVGS